MTDTPSPDPAAARLWLETRGADRTRWPKTGRAAAAAAIAASPALRALEAEAARLDAALVAWAAPRPPSAADREALARILQRAEAAVDAAPAGRPAPSRFRPRPVWLAAGAAAAGLAMIVLLARPEPRSQPAPAAAAATAPAAPEEAEAFGLLHTLTVEEELSL